MWQKVHAKRMATGIKQPSKIGKDRSHLLTGILKCPLCGSSMYTNKHAWTNKDGTYKEVYYYICGRNKQERGHHCDYKASLRKTDIEPLVIEAVKELVSDKYFAKEIEKRIGVQTDTTAIDKELANYESKLKEVDLNKARLEREIDNLPVDTRFRERKIHDMTLRLDALYDTIVELEERIEDAKLRKSSIEMETITLDNIYKLMLNFGKLYDIISDEEKKSLITYLIKEIQIYPNGESEQPLKSIEFNFPIYRDGQEVRRLLWEKGNTVEMLAMEDFCQLDYRLTQDKYKGSYERCAKIIEKYSSRVGLDMAEFYMRIVFSFVTGNSDMHLKNFSLIETEVGSGDYVLSPAYDLLPINVIMPEDTEQLAIPMNGKKRNVRRKDFLIFADVCGLSRISAEKMISLVVKNKDKMKKMCDESYIPEKMKSDFNHLIEERMLILAD